MLWDTSLAVINLLAPNRPANRVVPAGHPGFNGEWPEYVPPKEGDSRCSCPALNAMANHGILPHSGRNITFKELNATIRTTYNFSPSFCYFVPNYAAQMLSRDYSTDTFDLSDLDVHNGIEHDASLTREDVAFQPDQGKPSPRLVKELLECGTGPNGDLTPADLSRISGKRRTESRVGNGQFSLSTFHKLFGSSNSSTLLTIFGGRKDDLIPFLTEERIPDGWQSRIRHPFGLTLTEFNSTVLPVEFGIKEELPWNGKPKKTKSA
ncbi:chloroperoxidase-like protein [Irpex rosettiformis]|uniref:Chloroperoxidase-like protein n=1 Tax=Irpex rosettiformis TaxID=378272 RepID=A0ACB8U5C8_9APHY|nr:chloroperoxidase-like protein [Irpex rosettiformis]